MKIISHSRDNHEALISLAMRSIEVHDAARTCAEIRLQAAQATMDAYESQPWYKRWFQFAWDPISDSHIEHERYCIWDLHKDLEFLRELLYLATYELTIELDDSESNVLFRRS